ncbi:type II toxin-antitoxin system prevent-host-death family antitoxin [Streptomyces sp. ECR3.8]|uniref:type II toxin-antitoxin system prevent-host-death family antitoxin n=1 Tax=Streptomyces sp. ECR3.8 TaxID=3461009 RepID=UPI00404348DC
MPTPRTEHRAKIAEARNVLGEVISRARYADEPTILVNRGKEAAVIVSHPFYEQALRDRALIEQLTAMAGLPEGVSAEERPDLVHTARILYEALAKAERDVNAARNVSES